IQREYTRVTTVQVIIAHLTAKDQNEETSTSRRCSKGSHPGCTHQGLVLRCLGSCGEQRRPASNASEPEVRTNRPLPWRSFNYRLAIVAGELKVHGHALFARTILSSCTPLLPWAFTLFLSATITTFRSRWAIFVKLGHLLLPSFAHDKCSRHGNTHRSNCLS